MSDYQVLHSAEKLIAHHRAAVEEVKPLLNLARAYFADDDGVVTRKEIASTIRAELATLAERHNKIRAAIADVHAILPPEKE